LIRVEYESAIDSKPVDIADQSGVQADHPLTISTATHGKGSFPMSVEVGREFHEFGVGRMDRENPATLCILADPCGS
jgi:hypothetical protein